MTLFFIAVAFVFLLIASTKLMPLIAWWPGLVISLFLASRSPLPRQLSLSGVLFAVFCTLLLLQAILFLPQYDAKAGFLPFTLLLPFLVFSHLPRADRVFRFASGVVVLVSCFGLYLWCTGVVPGRASAIFGTPNTFATLINLFLAPMLAYYLFGKGGRGVFALILLLFTTLLATQSRGGYLGLLAGMGFFGVFVGAGVLRSSTRRIAYVAAGFVSSALLLRWLPTIGVGGGVGGMPLTSPQSSEERLQLYAVAWQVLKEHFPGGIGNFSFRYYFEILKPQSWQDRHTSFVHNDYLQLAVENGLLGIGIFLAMMAALYFYLMKVRQRAVDEQRLSLIMPAVGVTSMLTHAMVDFPFYVPLFQAILGAYLGVINQQLIEMGTKRLGMPNIAKWKLPGLSAGFLRNTTVIALIVWLGLPFFAMLASNYSTYRQSRGDPQGGVYWISIARTLQPKEALYYRIEGLIWRDLGVARHDARMLKLADAAFARGIEANPFDIMNLLERIVLHRQHQEIEQWRASREEVLTWVLRARNIQPYSLGVQIEYVHCLIFLGRQEDAIEQAKIILKSRPHLGIAESLLKEVSGTPNGRAGSH